MSLVVKLRTHSGSTIGTTGESYDSIADGLPLVEFDAFPLAWGIDRDGITMFNPMQMSRLADEFRRMLPGATKRRTKLLQELIDLCVKGSSTGETELWFEGD